MNNFEEKFRIYRGDGWISLVHDYAYGKWPVIESLKKKFSEKKFSVKDTNITYRVINHWMAEGLISDARTEEKGWRKLSIFDLIWINAIIEMRKFGMPIPTLRSIHKSISKPMSKHKKHSSPFEVGVCLCIQHEPVYLIVFNDGGAEVARKCDIEFSLQIGVLLEKSYLLVSLNSCCEAMLGGVGKASYPIGLDLDIVELEAIELIRNGELDSLEISFRDGKPQKLTQFVKQNRPKTSLDNLVNKIEYGEMKAKIQDGVVVLTEVSKSKKVQ